MQASLEGGSHASLAGATALAVNEDVNELANGFNVIVSLLEDANLIGDGAGAQLVDAQSEVNDSRELDRGEVVAVGVHDEANLGRGGWVESAVGDEEGVDDGIEEIVVDRIVEVVVHVVVAPAGAVLEQERIVAPAARFEGVVCHGEGVEP